MRVCGTTRRNRGIPRDLEREARQLKTGQSAFPRKSDVMVQAWMGEKTCALISTIHDATLGNTGRKEKQTCK
jgi:hypothetical protein